MHKRIRGLSLLAMAGLLFATATTGHADTVTGKVSDGNNDLLNPTVAVYDVKCKTKAPICASVWDESPDFSYQDVFHVSAICISPTTLKGKGEMQYYVGFRDGGTFSPDACTGACSEALVMVQCDLGGSNCDDNFLIDMECNGGTIGKGYPKKVQ